jgi:hypothetical protein
MNSRLKIALFAVLLAASVPAFAASTSNPSGDTTLADDVIGNLYVMKSVYRAEYAPADWKRSFAGYDLDTEFNKAIAAVQANPNLTLADARAILKNFIYAMKDYHTSISFVSTELATLPLTIKGTDTGKSSQDKFFIAYIDRTKLPEASFPFHVGDEVVTFDGKLTGDAVAAVQAETPANVPTTDRALAENYLTKRQGSRGLKVPQGAVTLGIKAQGSSITTQIQLVWDYTPEKIHPLGSLSRGFAAGVPTGGTIFHPMMNVALADAPSTDNPYDLGGKKAFTPALGTKIWESAESDFFDAYIYKTADRKLIGYIRIASYEAPDYPKAVAEFARDIALFESATDALVIDQVNNPGGSVFYLYTLASMLTTQPLYTPLHRMSITQADVSDALAQIEQLRNVKNDEDAKKAIPAVQTDGYPISYEFAQFRLNYDRFIVDEWNQGHKLTRPYWIDGVDHINPAATHYSKPILLLINHLDFSGGDFFPATLQDNNRVTIFGSRTAGAGGYVNDIKVPNNIGVNAFRCTESIAERVNQDPIENLGVKPDIEYSMSKTDFTQNYTDYVKAIQSTLAQLTK